MSTNESEIEMNEATAAQERAQLMQERFGEWVWTRDENDCARILDVLGPVGTPRSGSQPFAPVHQRQQLGEHEMTDHLHYIEHIHEAGYGVHAKFICTGDRTSPCHQYPPAELAMERWSDADKHLFVSHDECWIEFWMNEECAVLCGPDREPVRSGPITVSFEDCLVWEYAEPAVTPGDVHQARA